MSIYHPYRHPLYHPLSDLMFSRQHIYFIISISILCGLSRLFSCSFHKIYRDINSHKGVQPLNNGTCTKLVQMPFWFTIISDIYFFCCSIFSRYILSNLNHLMNLSIIHCFLLLYPSFCSSTLIIIRWKQLFTKRIIF